MGPKAYDTEVRKSSALVEAQIGGYSLVMTNIASETGHLYLIYLFQSMHFHSHDSLPEGSSG